MSGSVNKVILVGNVGQDPEIRSFQSGGKVCNLSLATSERWKDRESNEQKERTQWHRVVVFNENLINLIEQYVKKGSKLFIEGQLETRKWTDSSGVEKYATEVVLRNFKGELTFLDSRGSSNDNYSDNNNNQINNEIHLSPSEMYSERPLGILTQKGFSLVVLKGALRGRDPKNLMVKDNFERLWTQAKGKHLFFFGICDLENYSPSIFGKRFYP
mgnify:CR=1 FL=1